jgi:hypothetical protein
VTVPLATLSDPPIELNGRYCGMLEIALAPQVPLKLYAGVAGVVASEPEGDPPQARRAARGDRRRRRSPVCMGGMIRRWKREGQWEIWEDMHL